MFIITLHTQLCLLLIWWWLGIVMMLDTQYCVLPPSDGVTSSPKLLHARPAVLGQGLFTTTMWHNVFLLTSTHIQRLINYNNNVFLMTNIKIQHTINHRHNVSLITNTQIQVLINTTQYVLYYKHINTSTYQSQHNVFLFINTQIQVLIYHKHMCSSLQTHQYKFSLITNILCSSLQTHKYKLSLITNTLCYSLQTHKYKLSLITTTYCVLNCKHTSTSSN